tara:strand:- start:1578 stop:2324 length:747 start_codon:yes stop_codon:yes gene_type:complete
MQDFRNYESQGRKFYKSLSEKDLNIIRKYVPEPKVIMEFGSCDGGDGIYLKNNFPKAEVYSIEACPERFKIVSQLEEPFGLHVSNYAVSDVNGVATFYQSTDQNQMDSDGQYSGQGSLNKKTDLYKNSYPNITELEPISVNTITVKTFCVNNKINHVDYMHIDVEGAELKVISGFGDMRPKLIKVEVVLGKDMYGEFAYDQEELKDTLTDMNYTQVAWDGVIKRERFDPLLPGFKETVVVTDRFYLHS